jgi:hypothetical protein
MEEADMTAQDFTNGFRKAASRTTAVHAVYWTAVGVATVGWLYLLLWGAAALLSS